MPVQKRAPRLKESCDACSTAKVRCTKDKPNCSRCQQKGMSCSYSFSRRAGRKTTTSALLTKADRRPRSPTSSVASSPIHPYSAPGSPTRLHDSSSSSDYEDDFELYSAQPTAHMHNPFAWDLQDSLLNAYTFPPQPLPAPTQFDMPPPGTMGLHAPPMMPRENSSSSISSSSSSSTMAESVHDELGNLTSLAESMERKFDAVVRARLQYRDVYSDFGVPVDDLEAAGSGSGSPMHISMPATGNGQTSAVATPDVNELAFYYSLAELKRRLKWVREDVGSLMGGVMAPNSLLC